MRLSRLFVSCLGFWLTTTITIVVGETKEDERFLYLIEDPEKVYPIQEYKAQPRSDGEIEKPKFLYDKTYPFPRIVEFYAHWCPHCQHFKPKYIQFGKQLNELTKKLQISVETYAVSCEPNKKICQDMGVHGYPTVQYFAPNSINGTKVNYWELHPLRMLRLFGLDAGQDYDYEEVAAPNGGGAGNGGAGSAAQEDATSGEDENAAILGGMAPLNNRNNIPINDNNGGSGGGSASAAPPHFMPKSKKETFHDAHLSFDFLMRNAVYFGAGSMEKGRKKALKEFIRVLVATFPPTSSLQPLVNDLTANFDKEVSQSEAQLIAILDKYPPPAQTWSPSCKLHQTGYTCGLWQLFHIMSIGLVEWNQWAMDDDQKLMTSTVGSILRDFIGNFFQCEECRIHFLNEYDACGHDLCNRLNHKKEGSTIDDWIQFPLWLYETHNGVNIRLRKERIEEEHDEASKATTEMDVMWPPIDGCPACWLSDGRWDEEIVYKYLRLHYWPEDFKSKQFRTEIVNSPNHLIAQQRREEEALVEFSEDSKNDRNPIDKILAAPKKMMEIKPFKSNSNSNVNKFDDDDDDDYSEYLYKPFLLVGSPFVLYAMISYYRKKKQYYQRGFYKKQESDFAV